MTQEEIARIVGISQAQVSRIECGESNASWPVAKKIARLTETEPDLWIDGSDPGVTEKRTSARTNAVWILFRKFKKFT